MAAEEETKGNEQAPCNQRVGIALLKEEKKKKKKIAPINFIGQMHRKARDINKGYS